MADQGSAISGGHLGLRPGPAVLTADRTTRSLSLTESGRLSLERAARILADGAAVEAGASMWWARV
jgi:hypothetical protein